MDCITEGVTPFKNTLLIWLVPAVCSAQLSLGTSPSAPRHDAISPPEAATPTATPLTLDEAVAMAGRNNPRIRGAAAYTARADAAAQTAAAYTNPSVEVFMGQQYGRSVPSPGVPGLLQHYAVYQPIEIPTERRARQRIAELGRQSSRFGEAGVLRSVSADAKHAFYAVLRSREEVDHTKENLNLVEDLRRRVEVEVNLGEKGRLELTRAEAEYAQASFAVRSAQLEASNAIALLRLALAAPQDADLNPQGALAGRVQLPPLSELREIVLRSHPAVSQSQVDVQTAQATLDHERKLRLPRPIAFAEYENQPDVRYWRTGITIPIPLTDRRRGLIEDAKATISQNQALLDQRRLELISATERSYEQYQLADQQATSLESGQLRAAESAVEAAQAAYRFGERGLVEVLDAQRVLQAVRGDLLDAQFARQSALIDLEELGAYTPGGKP